MLPTLAIIKNEKTTDYVIGLDELGGSEDFTTGERGWARFSGGSQRAEPARCGQALCALWQPVLVTKRAHRRRGAGPSDGMGVPTRRAALGGCTVRIRLLVKSRGGRPAPVSLAEVLAARLAAAGAVFEDALPAARQGAAEAQQRTMRQGGRPQRTESDEDSDFD